MKKKNRRPPLKFYEKRDILAKPVAWLVSLLMVAVACGADPSSPDVGVPATTTSSVRDDSTIERDRPPDVVVIAGDTELVLSAHSYCWTSGSGNERQGVCADGAPPDPLPRITLTDAADLAVVFPLTWSIEGRFLPDGAFCNGGATVTFDPGGTPAGGLGPAGRYRVELFGRGDQGDAAWAFELISTTDRETPPPFAQVFWYPSGGDLAADAPFGALIGNITTPPDGVTAAVTVTAADGASQQHGLSVAETRSCWEGTIGFEAPRGFTSDTLQLEPPYEAVISVTIDGSTITSHPVRWPDDFPPNSNESRRVAATATPTVPLHDNSGLACSDKAGVDPPASIRVVGATERVVPFQSWSCLGYAADGFIDPVDYSLVSDEGTVDVFFESASDTALSAKAWKLGGSKVQLVSQEIGPGRIRIVLPDPDEAWVIQIKLLTTDQRVAYYNALVESATSGRISDGSSDGVLDCLDGQVVRGPDIDVSADSEQEVVAAALAQWTKEGGSLVENPPDESWYVVLDGRDVAIAYAEINGDGTWTVHDVRTCGEPETGPAPIDGELDCANEGGWGTQGITGLDTKGVQTPQEALRSTLERWQTRYGGEIVIIDEHLGSLVIDDREQVKALANEAPAGGWIVLTTAGCEGFRST